MHVYLIMTSESREILASTYDHKSARATARRYHRLIPKHQETITVETVPVDQTAPAPTELMDTATLRTARDELAQDGSNLLIDQLDEAIAARQPRYFAETDEETITIIGSDGEQYAHIDVTDEAEPGDDTDTEAVNRALRVHRWRPVGDWAGIGADYAWEVEVRPT